MNRVALQNLEFRATHDRSWPGVLAVWDDPADGDQRRVVELPGSADLGNVLPPSRRVVVVGARTQRGGDGLELDRPVCQIGVFESAGVDLEGTCIHPEILETL